ncbi:hypothetical protein SKUN_001212 [Spiroplasma kunkelii CR2-3x]|uniref:Uncharacterized protein n=1 Tax=Spiroplasma kunkelii CR2-3x TaxID=273035 RepID=A0A0K2JI27_SPIKU|nr:hypothetical protein [Spiroplasma kunkelii]ALA98087.1 hypothetical protein SKUN_001212 [Spiroplasma kunkelii CR2-3x]
MEKRYLLVMKYENEVITKSFYKLEEAKITANVENQQEWLTTIIDLEDENIKWQRMWIICEKMKMAKFILKKIYLMKH